MSIEIIKGDITKLKVCAIVNAANESLLGGGGVDGAIHRAAGPDLLKECRTLNGCKTGEAKITKGYLLPAKYVIHTVGPVYKDGNHREEQLLRSAYRESLKMAYDAGCKTVAFPVISAGVYGYPKEEALSVAVSSISDTLEELNLVGSNATRGNNAAMMEVYLVIFDKELNEIAEEEPFKKYLHSEAFHQV